MVHFMIKIGPEQLLLNEKNKLTSPEVIKLLLLYKRSNGTLCSQVGDTKNFNQHEHFLICFSFFSIHCFMLIILFCDSSFWAVDFCIGYVRYKEVHVFALKVKTSKDQFLQHILSREIVLTISRERHNLVMCQGARASQ